MRLKEVRDALSSPGQRRRRFSQHELVTLNERYPMAVTSQCKGGREPGNPCAEHGDLERDHLRILGRVSMRMTGAYRRQTDGATLAVGKTSTMSE